MAAVAYAPLPDSRLEYARRAVLNFAQRRNLPPWIDRDDLVQEGIAGVLAADPPDHSVGLCAVRRALDYLRRRQGTTTIEKDAAKGQKGRKWLRPEATSLDQALESGVDLEAPPTVYFFRDELAAAAEKRAERQLYKTAPAENRKRRLARLREEQPALGQRELEVLRATAEGETAEETAHRLTLSAETVKSQRRVVIAKLGARNVTHAVHLAHERGLL
jgi:RNA polymerase sigma factor (sigma-70 family)